MGRSFSRGVAAQNLKAPLEINSSFVADLIESKQDRSDFARAEFLPSAHDSKSIAEQSKMFVMVISSRKSGRKHQFLRTTLGGIRRRYMAQNCRTETQRLPKTLQIRSSLSTLRIQQY